MKSLTSVFVCNRQFAFCLLFIAFAVSFLFVPSTNAGSVYTVEYTHRHSHGYGTADSPTYVTDTISDSQGVSMDNVSSVNFYRYGTNFVGSTSVHSAGYAADQSIGVHGTATANSKDSFNYTTAQLQAAEAYMEFDDLIITKIDEPDAQGKWLNYITMNVHVSGTFSQDGSYQRIDLQRNWHGGWTIPGTAGSNMRGVFSGLADYRNIDDTFVIDMGSAELGKPVTFGVGMVIALTAQIKGLDKTQTNSADFMSTIAFPSGGPVFNLPQGYTANSVSAGIVDNRFVVPEPATVFILAIGGILLSRRRVKS